MSSCVLSENVFGFLTLSSGCVLNLLGLSSLDTLSLCMKADTLLRILLLLELQVLLQMLQQKIPLLLFLVDTCICDNVVHTLDMRQFRTKLF